MKRLWIYIMAIIGVASTASAIDYEVKDSTLIVPAGVVKIPSYKFADRADIKYIEFAEPCRVNEIGDYAFLGCINLEEVSLPLSVLKIGEGTFRECEKLKKAEIPTLTVVPSYAFAWCPRLQMVVLGKLLTAIKSHAFAYCRTLERIKLPAGLVKIGSNAFSFCSVLRFVAIPPTVRHLESYAFSECINLQTVVMPSNSSELGELIFSGCRNLRVIRILSDIPPKFECNSNLFEENESQMYSTCILQVYPHCVPKYRQSKAWKMFKQIEG